MFKKKSAINNQKSKGVVPIIAQSRLVAGLADQPLDLFPSSRKVVPALLTTFSSIMTEPKSFAPYLERDLADLRAWVTHELWRLGMLSRKMRAAPASAGIRRNRSAANF